MKQIIQLLAVLLVATFSYAQNATIEVTITDPSTAQIKLTSGGQEKKSINNLNFSDGNGKLIIINKTKEDVSVDFIDISANPVFKIASKNINKKTNDGDPDAVTTFTIDKDGNLSPAIPSGVINKELGIVVNTKTKPQAVALAAVKSSVDSSSTSVAIESFTAEHLRTFVEKQIDKQGYTYVAGQNNLIIDDKGIVHIYLDMDGNPIYTYFPVAAKENYDKFQIHIISPEGFKYVIASTGEFEPKELSDEIDTKAAVAQSGGAKVKLVEIRSAIFGPYTRLFPVTINRTTLADGGNKLILDKSIKLLKTSRVSINTGVVSTWLRSPENISTFLKPNGDTTLIADDPNVRGYLTLMLTFHFKPRNLNIQPRNASERLGISVGTNLSSNAFDNFFLGLNIEVTNGLFINGGGHFGHVNHVVNYDDDFKYGEDTFSGTLETKKKWNFGPYLAINIDAALFAKVFKNLLSPSDNSE